MVNDGALKDNQQNINRNILFRGFPAPSNTVKQIVIVEEPKTFQGHNQLI